MTGEQKLSIQKGRTLFSRPGLSLAGVRRFWLVVKTNPWVAELKSWCWPVVEELPGAGRDPRIVSSSIIILGLMEVIFVGFLVGRSSGSLHPVWRVISELCALGIGAFGIRLAWVLRRKPRL